MTEIQHLIAFSMIKGLGPVTLRTLISYVGDVTAIAQTSSSKLLNIPNIGTKTVDLLKQLPATLKAAEQEVTFCEHNKIEVLTYTDARYPQKLTQFNDSPLVLFKKGNADLNAQKNIAIVGTRTPSEYGKQCATEFAQYFAEQGINIVSGLAYGIDITAHKAVLQKVGITTAVVGHGLDRIYPPSHYEKALKMLENGAWLTEYVSGTKPDAPNFPARNRIISGISDAILVVEAAKSGGALITARFGADQNNRVYAIPGELGKKYSEGCNLIIKEGIAQLVMSPQEILDDLQIQWQNHPISDDKEEIMLFQKEELLGDEEQKIVNALKKQPFVIDELSIETQIPMAQLNGILTMMEFQGLVEQVPGKKFKLR